MITDLGNGRAAGQAGSIPTPSCIRARQVTAAPAVPPVQRPMPAGAVQISLAGGDSGRVTARSALYAALSGIRLGGRDRQFLAKLVHWDKRNAASVAALIWRAREAGRQEAALTPRQLEVVLAALSDAAIYRAAGSAAAACWDCENVPAGRCAEHAKDNDRAKAYAEVAAVLSGAALPSAGQDGLPQPRDLAGYRHRAPVAS